MTGVAPGRPLRGAQAAREQAAQFRRPSPAEALSAASRGLGISHLRPPAPPPQEAPSRAGAAPSRGSATRWAATRRRSTTTTTSPTPSTSYVLGPSMTYTCAVFPTEDATLEEAQARQVRPGRPQARPPARAAAARRRLRLGRHGPPRGPRVRRARRSASRCPASRRRGRRRRSRRRGSTTSPRSATCDYRDVDGAGFDAISLDRADRAHRREELPGRTSASSRTGSAPRAGCSTTASPATTTAGARPAQFIDRYVFPDGELIGIGQDHHRGAERRPRGAARGELPAPLRQDPGRLVPEPRGQLGRLRRRGRRGHGAGLGPLHGRARGSPSSATRSSSTTCSRPRPTTQGQTATRCARRSRTTRRTPREATHDCCVSAPGPAPARLP